jgi:hypothetical protein
MASSGMGPVERATRADLRRMGVSVQTSGKAAAAVSLAFQMDAARGGVSAATAAGQLRGLLDDLAKASAAANPAGSGIDDLRARREARRTG